MDGKRTWNFLGKRENKKLKPKVLFKGHVGINEGV